MKRVVFRGFRIIDEASDFWGSVVVEDGIIRDIIDGDNNVPAAGITVDGRALAPSAVLMPAFVDLHAHFREPGFPEKENLESASLAAVAGGFVTVVCMANTRPAIDSIDKARALKARSDVLGLVDLHPVLSLTKGMEGRELSGIKDLRAASGNGLWQPLMLSEDGNDLANDDLFLAAMGEARRLGVPVSCHCQLDGTEEAAVRRAIELGKKAGCHIHIAHVSTKEAAESIRAAKRNLPKSGCNLTCEAAPHHIGATDADAMRMGAESYGRVNPRLQGEADRQAIIAALLDGTIDAIATDHAPHSDCDKAAGSPGFSGLETAFAVCLENLVTDTYLQRLSRLMSTNPARIIGLNDRGRIAVGQRADLVVVDTEAVRKVDPEKWKSKGKCSPFAGRELRGKITMTFNAGKMVFGGNGIG